MFTVIKLVQYLVKTLHSEGTPGQVAAGIVLGAALGLTPIASAHNLVIVLLICVLNVSVAGAFLGLAFFAPFGFLLDPVFDRLGRLLLLETPALESTWTALYNTPVVPYTNFNNTVVLGSLVGWLLLAVPIHLLARLGIARYRATVGERVRQSRFYRAVTASKAYNVYTWFRPQ
ncbi:MAG TPA: TIGR03546 family protein [Gemmatimonadaceae bacterium]|nr:TIGR03546 family protein [Gemmatimonadaceae bacterium]